MDLLAVKLENFKSFRGRHVWQMPALPGLYLVSGRNETHPELGGNATGKSTLWDALFWCLYGRTARGLRASNVVTWRRKKGCRVSVRLSVDGRQFTVVRTQSPNSLTLAEEKGRLKPVEQPTIDGLVGYTSAAFLHGILAGQFGNMFFDLPPTAKLDLLTGILELELWLSSSQRAKQQCHILAAKIERLSQDVAHAEGTIEELTSLVASTRAESKERRRQLVSEESTTRNDLSGLYKTLKSQKVTVGVSTARCSACKRLCREGEDRLASAKQVEQKASDAYRSVLVKRDNALRSLAHLRLILTSLSESFPWCPTCHQKVGRQHLKAEVGKVNGDIRKEETRLLLVKKKVAKAERRVGSRAKSVRRVDGTLEGGRSALLKAEEEVIARRNSCRETQQAIENAKAGLVRLAQEKKSATRQLEDLKVRRANAQKERRDGQQLLAKKRRKRERYEFWITGFKDVRLWIVDQAMRQLEACANNSLLQLGLHDWSIRMDVERETKAGKVSRGFNVFVRSPDSPDEVPWEAWSGGETQRLRLAGAMGLMDLIADRVGQQPTVEVWDEPTDRLSGDGIDDLITLLSSRAGLEQKRIFLVDHRSLDAGRFDGHLKIVYNANGSHLVQEGSDAH